jgi:hypothetical protein
VSVDQWSGDPQSPTSLHQYLYANNSPIINFDPSGKFTLIDVGNTLAVLSIITGYAVPMYNSLFKKYIGCTDRFTISMGFGFGTAPVLLGPYIGFTSATITEKSPSGNDDPNFKGHSANYLVYSFGLGFGDDITFYSAESPFRTDHKRNANSFAGIGNAMCSFQIGGGPVSFTGVALTQLPDGTLIDNSFQLAQGADTKLISFTAFVTMCLWQLIN